MSCGGMGGCGGSSSSQKSSNHSTKKAPNWGMTKGPGTKSTNNSSSRGSGSFGTPKVRMSFRGSNRN